MELIEMTRQQIKTFVVCPHCGHDVGTIDHLLDGKDHSWGRWYCDTCGGACEGSVIDNVVVVARSKSWRHETYEFLQLHGYLFIFDGRYFTDTPKARVTRKVKEEHKYYYEEHTCPVNFVRADQIIDISTKDLDPHGMFTYITSVDKDLFRDEAALQKFALKIVDLIEASYGEG